MAFQFKPDFWYSIDDVIEESGIGRDTLALWRSNGDGPEFSKIGKRVYYNGTTLTQFFMDRLRHSTTDQGRAA